MKNTKTPTGLLGMMTIKKKKKKTQKPTGPLLTVDQVALLTAFHSSGDEFYQYLIKRDFRVGKPISVVHSGNEEVIRHCGSGTRGDLDYCQVTVKRSNRLPQPISSRAAAIFQHFIKIQYRDVRSKVIQQVMEDYVQGGGTLVTTSELAATNDAELAFWLHCAETRKPCVRLQDASIDIKHISVHCPQGFCFHPDALNYIGEILWLYARPSTAGLTGIQVSAYCSEEGGEKAAQAIVKQFAEAPGLLVKDWSVDPSS